MDSPELLSAARVVAAVAVLAYASMMDVRTRKVPNKYWIILSVFGLGAIVLEILIQGEPVEYLVILVPVLAVLSDIYIPWGKTPSAEKLVAVAKYAIAVVSIVIIAVIWGSNSYMQDLLEVPIMMLLIVALYMLDAIRGGADAKALVGIAVVFPFYPSVGPFPLIGHGGSIGVVPIPFALVALITAAVIVALTPLGFLIRNAGRGELKFPQALLGYKMDVKEAERAHIWLMERIVEGRHVIYTRPKREEDLGKELRLLAEAGQRRVWVTPKIPFIVPILFGTVFAFFVGDLLELLFPL